MIIDFYKLLLHHQPKAAATWKEIRIAFKGSDEVTAALDELTSRVQAIETTAQEARVQGLVDEFEAALNKLVDAMEQEVEQS
jgi:hypothetical protein